ncbi:hypothetical protein L209DRAFT_419913 [Thermothelomyces heterothallicus CBS 203.75]
MSPFQSMYCTYPTQPTLCGRSTRRFPRSVYCSLSIGKIFSSTKLLLEFVPFPFRRLIHPSIQFLPTRLRHGHHIAARHVWGTQWEDTQYSTRSYPCLPHRLRATQRAARPLRSAGSCLLASFCFDGPAGTESFFSPFFLSCTLRCTLEYKAQLQSPRVPRRLPLLSPAGGPTALPAQQRALTFNVSRTSQHSSHLEQVRIG